MFKNHLKIAWRNLVKNKAYAAINIFGLTLGITACFIIYLETRFELSFDNFHQDKARINRVVSSFQNGSGDKNYSATVPEPMPAVIRSEFTGIESVAQFHTYYVNVSIPDGSNEPKRFNLANEREDLTDIIITDPEYFDIFRYHWLEGNAVAMKKPFQVTITESKARRYFGTLPLNKIIGREIVYDDSLRLTVCGIVKDYPKNSDLIFKDFISSSTIQQSFLKSKFNFANWQNWDGHSQVFIRNTKGTMPLQFEKQADELVKKYMDIGHGFKVNIWLQPLSQIHFNGDYAASYGRQVHLPTLYGLMGIAVFILLIAAINFINLSTAQSLQRVKEIGIRKVLGSKRSGLVLQFLSETFILIFVSVMLSIIIVPPLFSAFHSFLPEGLTLTIDTITLIFLLLVTVITTMLAGLYPAKVLSSYLPVQSLKGEGIQPGKGKNYLRKALIVFQFTISLVFIIGTLIMGGQIHYLLNKDMGFTKDAIINIPTNRLFPKEKKELLAKQIKQLEGVKMVSVAMGTPAENNHWGTTLTRKETGKDEVRSQFQTGDENYLSLYQLKLVAGRNLMPSDSMKEYLVNENCAKKLGFKNPGDAIGKLLKAGTSDRVNNTALPIVGVLADFHSQSLREPIAPTFMSTSKQISRVISVRLSTKGKHVDNFNETIARIEKLWKGIYPNDKFAYKFFDETIAGFYEKELKTEQVMYAAMAIAIFISCMGLFGLATFTAQQRTREIGIRKVLGASVATVVSMLSKDFLKLVVIAILIASPIAYYFMHQWLREFAYRISISWWVFALAGMGAILIALLTVSYQAIKAAIANPVKSLRTE